jgi:hypothetical protein
MEQLTKFVESLRTNLRLSSYGEEATKQSIILPFLNMLGWNVFNIDEVMPELTIENGRVDYALRVSNVNEVFVEVKKPSEDLDKIQYQEQLLNYSFRHGVELAVLTNGTTWWFFLPKEKGDWKSRKFYSIDIIQQDVKDAVQKFIDLLSKSNVESGKALQTARTIYKGKMRHKVLEDTLPDSWNKIVTEPDSLLLELISETTEKLCGFKPDIDDVERFVKRYQVQLTISSVPPPPPPPPKKDERIDQGRRRMTIMNDVFVFKKAVEILKNTTEWLIRTGKLKASNYPIQLPGSDRYIIHNQPVHKSGRPFDNKAKLSNGLYLLTNFSAPHCELYSRRLLEYFGVSPDALRVE